MSDQMTATMAGEDFGLAGAAIRMRKSRPTIARWATQGVKLRSGEVVKLRGRMVGSRLRFTQADLDSFVARTTAAAEACS